MDAKPSRRIPKNRQSQLPQRVDTVDAAQTVDAKCEHCKTGARSRPRGLCWTCYYDDDVLNQYSSQHTDHGRRDRESLVTTPPLAPEPTRHMPGTAEKFQVMIERAAAGYQIFHPADARHDLINDSIPATNKSFAVPADPDGDLGDEADPLPDMPRVDSLNHRGATVAECMSYLRGSKSRRDCIAGIGVPEAVGGNAPLNAAVQADAGRQPPDMVAETILEPRIPVGVDENHVAPADSLEREQQTNGERVEADDTRSTGLAHGLVLDQDQVRGLDGEPARIPSQFPHLTGSAAGPVEEQQRPLDLSPRPFQQRPEFVVGGWPASLGNHATQGSRTAVRAVRDNLLVPGPAKATQHARYRSPLGIHGFPFRVSGQKLGQIMLAKLRNWPIAKLAAELCQVAAVGLADCWREVSALNSSLDIREVDRYDVEDGLRSVRHGVLLRKLDSG